MATPILGFLPVLLAVSLGAAGGAHAAQGEMGKGVPQFGVYGTATGPAKAVVWRLESASLGMPSGCTRLFVSAATMGAEGYKFAMATMTAARVLNRAVRFYAHAERDGGCGVDYVELL